MNQNAQMMRLQHEAVGEEEAVKATEYSDIWPFDPTVVDKKKSLLLMRLWAARTLRAARVHYGESLSLNSKNRYLTSINAALSIAILFLTNAGWVQQLLGIDLPKWMGEAHEFVTVYTVLVSILAMSLVITTIWQYILRWSERSGEHRRGGAEFANLHRKIERYCISTSFNMSMIHNINREYNHISKSYPLVHQKKWDKYDGEFITKMEEMVRNDWQEEV